MSDFVQDFFTSRQNYADGNTRIGQLDRLWYDSITNTIRVSDGITPGGIIVSGGGSGLSGYSGFSGSGISNWIKVTSNYTASNGDRIIADTTGGTFTINLPAAPAIGSYVQIFGSGLNVNNLTVSGNGSTIEGSPSNLTLSETGAIYDFIYDGSTWQVSSGGGGLGASGYSGVSGKSGYSGSAGASGYSGYSGLGLSAWQLITSNYYSQNNNRIIADTQSGSFTIYLPAAPVTGYYVQITDGWDFAINNCFVDPNGSTVENLPDIVALDLKGVTFEFIYNGTTWEVTGTTGARGQSGYSGTSGYSGNALAPWALTTSNINAQNNDRLIADTQGGSFTIYLPTSPITGDYIQITDGWNLAINNAFVDPGPQTVEGYTDIVALDLKGVTFEFIYNGTTWDVTGTTGARGQSGYSGLVGYSGLSGYSGASSVTFTKIVQDYNNLTSATGTVVHDCLLATVFNHSSIVSDFTANFTNLNLTANQLVEVTLILNQGSTPYVANLVEIDGTAYTVKWLNGNLPSGTANEVDFQYFNIIYDGSSYSVFGSLNSYQ